MLRTYADDAAVDRKSGLKCRRQKAPRHAAVKNEGACIASPSAYSACNHIRVLDSCRSQAVRS